MISNTLYILGGKGPVMECSGSVCPPGWAAGTPGSVRMREHVQLGVYACVHAVSLMGLGGCRSFSPHRSKAHWPFHTAPSHAPSSKTRSGRRLLWGGQRGGLGVSFFWLFPFTYTTSCPRHIPTPTHQQLTILKQAALWKMKACVYSFKKVSI